MRLPGGLASYGDVRAYSFDSKTILTTLDRSERVIFQPLPDWVGPENAFPPGSFAWQQQDYLKITSALNRSVSKNNLEGWSVYSIIVSRNCSDHPIGFDDFAITYFKTYGDRYSTQLMEIDPLANEAAWAGNANFPRSFPFGWKSIEMDKLKLTTDQALQMAEANGGKTARQVVNNACSISIALAPNADDAVWGVNYINDKSVTLFHFNISPY